MVELYTTKIYLSKVKLEPLLQASDISPPRSPDRIPCAPAAYLSLHVRAGSGDRSPRTHGAILPAVVESLASPT